MSFNLSALAVRERAVTLFFILLLVAAGALGHREGALPGDVGVGHCHARANFQTGSLVALVSGNGDGPRRTHTGTAAAIPGSS